MPTVHAVVSCRPRPSFRAAQVAGMFDLPAEAGSECSFNAELPSIDEPWTIGVIVGPSGSGKTTLARRAFGSAFIEKWAWPRDRSLLDAFPKALETRDIVHLLSSVGFSSPPAWLRPFHHLSNGEQFRASLARALAEKPRLAVVDEFTSLVDRAVARVASAAVARAVRRSGRRLLAVSCHYDILPWLEPDWILDMANGLLTRNPLECRTGRRRLRRPPIDLVIRRTTPAAWRWFSRHHYLSANIHPASQCFVATIDNQPAAFVAALPFPHPIAPGWREHRCVCLPDFQGLGIGSALSRFVASLYAAMGRRYTSVTSHPAMIRHRLASSSWRLLRRPSRRRPGTNETGEFSQLIRTSSVRRMTTSFIYAGEPNLKAAKILGLLDTRP